MKAARINMDDTFLELVPEAYLDQAEPAHDAVVGELEDRVRDKLAFLVKIDRAVFEPQLMDSPQRLVSPPVGWKRLKLRSYSILAKEIFGRFITLMPGPLPAFRARLQITGLRDSTKSRRASSCTLLGP